MTSNPTDHDDIHLDIFKPGGLPIAFEKMKEAKIEQIEIWFAVKLTNYLVAINLF